MDVTPWSIHVVTADMTQRDLSIIATVGPGVKGRETVKRLVEQLPRDAGQPIAAINGDYFEYKTEPRYYGTLQGTCIIDGELVSAGSFPTFWLDAERRPHIDQVRSALTLTWPNGTTTALGLNCSTTDYQSEVHAADVVLYTPAFGLTTGTKAGCEFVLEPIEHGAWGQLRPNTIFKARVREIRTSGNTPIVPGTLVVSLAQKIADKLPVPQVGDILTIASSFTPDLSTARMAVSGGPLLLMNGQIVPTLDIANRAPRTAIGIAGNHVVFLVVDGRQPGRSVGMSHRELAEAMQRYGCTDAVNLDGGGSSTFWYQGRVLNSPSDKRLRPVGNALILVKTTQ